MNVCWENGTSQYIPILGDYNSSPNTNDSWYSWIGIERIVFIIISSTGPLFDLNSVSKYYGFHENIHPGQPQLHDQPLYKQTQPKPYALWDILYLCHIFVCFMGYVIFMPHVRMFCGICYIYATRSYVLWDVLYLCHTFVCFMGYIVLMPHVRMLCGIYCTYALRAFVCFMG